jgi:23S rRNA (uridine2552-2'-O)-methyltransferase
MRPLPNSPMARKGGKSKSGGLNKGRRQSTVRVKTARRRSHASTQWLQRQLNDPYVSEAQRLGYRSRAAFKLIELDDKANLLRPGMRLVDLGAAPGGWTQVAVERVGAVGKGGRVIALDILEMDPVAGAEVLQADFTEDAAVDLLLDALDGPADVVLSDLANNTTGHPPTDHLRIMAMVELALDFAAQVLTPGGAFVAKVFQGGTEAALLAQMRKLFTKVRHIKPPASRSDSSETYVVATGFRGAANGSRTDDR